eukprot:Seg48.12 transcript_id=Seg48.12/GoldUCD/mRNA.D3Y31 product="Protein BCCIP-like" protein_id=Seg48.12/GoldUCD/D3Y31
MASKHKAVEKFSPEKLGKKRKIEKEDDDEGSTSSSDESELVSSSGSSETSGQDNQDINLDFEGMNITDEDFHGIRMLLQQLLVTISMNISELTELITSQKDIGSTLKIFDDDENTVYGLTTVVDLNKNKEKDCVEKFCKAIKDKCKETSKKSFNDVNECLEKRICFLINERFINIPGDVAAPMLNSLRSEMKEACKEGKLSDFDYILLVSKSVKAANPNDLEASNGEVGESSSSSTKLSKKEKKKLKAKTNEDLQFLNYEDELFYKAASFKFSYRVTKATGFAISGEWDFGDVVMDTFRTVMIIDYSKFDKIVEEIEVMSS